MSKYNIEATKSKVTVLCEGKKMESNLVVDFSGVASSSGETVEVASATEMDALLVEENVGNVYRYTGETTDTYENGALYEVYQENTGYTVTCSYNTVSVLGDFYYKINDSTDEIEFTEITEYTEQNVSKITLINNTAFGATITIDEEQSILASGASFEYTPTKDTEIFILVSSSGGAE